MATRAEKLRRRKHRKDKKREQGRRPVSELAPFGSRLIVDPPGEAKMSEVLLTLVDPYMDMCPNDEAMRKLLSVAVVAWTAALMPAEAGMGLVEVAAQKLPADVRADFRQIFFSLIKRKLQLFPHIQRPILDFHLSWRDGGPYLQVYSVLVPKKAHDPDGRPASESSDNGP